MRDDPAAFFTAPLRDLGDDTPAWHGLLAPVDASRSAPAGVTAQFLDHAADYHERYANVAHFRMVLDDAFARLERPPEPRTILDIGSGSGNSVIPLLDRFPEAYVVATDVSAPLLAILRDHLAAEPRYRGRYALVVVDAVGAPLRPASFDLAVGAAILHHVLEPERVVDACRVALRRGGIALFLEPFEMGHALLSVVYADLVDEAARRGEDGPGFAMVRRLLADYDARRRPRDDPRFLDMDDKWMFTRSFFEAAARRGSWTECVVYPLHDPTQPLTEQTRVNLKLGAGLDADALPAWAWAQIADCEQAFSSSARRDLTFECGVLLRAWPGDATTPPSRSGWWFDAAAPGRGFFITDDGEAASVTCCHYDDAGAPIWHVAGPVAWRDGAISATARRGSTPAPGGPAASPLDASPHAMPLTLRFESPTRARLAWGSEEVVLVPQHADSPGWRQAAGHERGGSWVEDRVAPGAWLAVEALDGRVFAALLTSDGWSVTVAVERRTDLGAGDWLRFSGGQSPGGPYRPPGDPVVLGAARLLWTEADRLVVQMPDGRHVAMRRGR